MPWPGVQLRLAVLLLAATVGPPIASAEGNVGCLFSDRLCLEDEWCFDDFAFGRCTPATSDIDEDDLYRYNLEREALHELSRELRRLFALGYRWSHGYTQCRLQALLYATKNEDPFEADACSHLVDQDLEGALRVMEGQVPLDPREVAIIKYTPSVDNPHSDFADEIFYPPIDFNMQAALREKILGPSATDILDMEDPYADYAVAKRTWIPQMRRRSPQFQTDGLDDYPPAPDETALEFLPFNDNDQGNEYANEDDPSYDSYPTLEDLRQFYPIIKFLNKMQLTPRDLKKILTPDDYAKLKSILDAFKDFLEENDAIQALENSNTDLDDEDIGHDPFEKFTLMYNTPDSFRAGWESRDELANEDYPESRIYFDENEDEQEYGSGLHKDTDEIFRELKNSENYRDDYSKAETGRKIFRELEKEEALMENTDGFQSDEADLKRRDNSDEAPKIYAEGGVVYSPAAYIKGASQEVGSWDDTFDSILDKHNLGFKRPERLDVKKPGPPFDAQINEVAAAKYRDEILPNMMKKEPHGGPRPHPQKFDNYNSFDDISYEYVYVAFKDSSIKTWGQMQDIIGKIFGMLHLGPSFDKGSTIENVVTFRVLPNSRGFNASEIARRIDSIKDDFYKATGYQIIETGVKDDDKIQRILSYKENAFYKITFMVCGVLAALILASALLILIRRHIKAKEKLQGLTRPDSEASKDYQDLCRARMAKGQPANDNVHGRITSLSKESEQSPSSRSSTSSWSEEPAIHNMDISTGHMVLSYMEDHLKNKDRLEQEWVALCAYVAEPCETSIANKKENVEKNRYPDIVPYDHFRVVLNELSNAASNDYINASTITDHDPRNPAYIATQGPLPHTSADFWQLIWEQGAVVIVMLTRLTESGAAMCHRYWPEEGSELYHIYEVHLVSEHIWCDDYLVRSFYLKNVRTGETRTVTQFHFLSWPETGVPASTKALLEFRRKVNKSYRGRSCPIVVHCSDGAGRTGTYCLIDMVLSRMAKGAKEIDIAATLEHLRDQRPKMVATKQQFEFVLTAVAEEVHAILKALPPQPTQQPEKEK